METNTHSAPSLTPAEIAGIVGAIKTFGEIGDPYEVLGVSRPGSEGDWLMKIRLVKTGEEAEYSYRHILEDPKAV
jgi:Family of unknown function (DUF5397)